MTDTYLLRLTGQQRDWLLAELHGYPGGSGTAITLYGRLLDAEPHDPRTVMTPVATAEPTPKPTAKPRPASRDDVLEHAGNLIGGARAETYGEAAGSFERIGRLWSTLLGIDISATDVARMMIAMKLSRLHHAAGHADSWVDIAGYAALGAEIAGVEL